MIFSVMEIIFSELFPSLVIISLYMKSYREIVKNIFILLLVIEFHIIVKSLFVPNKLVVLEVIVN